MANHNNNRSIWIVMKRLDLQEAGEDTVNDEVKDEVKEVRVAVDATSLSVQRSIREAFNVTQDHLLLKLRNSNGSLVPVNANLTQSQPSEPFTLEVVNIHQHVEPTAKSVMSRQGYVTYKHILTSFLQRIEKMEAEVPQLSTRRMDIIKQLVDDLNCKLVFLNKRFDQASHTDWKGMFRKPPLW